MSKPAITPQTANTTKKLCELKRDNVSTRNSWILVEEKRVIICNQRTGNEPTGKVRLTKREFDRFIKFYQTGV